MRRPETQARTRFRRPRPNRALLAVVVAVLFVALLSLRGVAGFYTDYLWYDELGITSVWRGVLGAKVALTVLFTGGFFLLMWVNLVLADRIAPRFVPDNEVVARYQETLGEHAGKVRVAVAALLALVAGAGAATQWNNWLLFRNSVDFGVEDPQFGEDISFFVFRLPFLTYVVDWLFVALVLVLLIVGVAHYLNGGIRVQAGVRVTPQVKAHLSVLLGLLALVKAVDYWFQRFELEFSGRGPVQGATYTDVNAQLPALNLLVVISIAAFVLFVVNIWLRGWVLPVIAVALWALLAVAVAGIYPAFVQKFTVEPDEAQREEKFIARNIEATRHALGIDDVSERSFAHSQDLDAATLASNAETIRNIRLWDPTILQDTYERLQELRAFFRFNDVDIDRYMIGDELTQVVLSARELDPEGLPSQRQSWVNRHLQFTHGYGAVLSPANAVTADGQPDFLVKDVPPESAAAAPEIVQPEVYFGEGLGGYAIVATDQGEIDYITTEGTDQTSSYRGEGGIALDSPIKRAAMALRLGDINVLISDSVQPSSKALFRRDIRERAEAAAPFLRYDSDPYPVLIDGRIKWVIDAYTTTNHYPYAQGAETGHVRSGSGLRGHAFNYVRNSVKVVIDAYDGDMTFYVIDPTDPIVSAYQKAFPELFTDGQEMSDEMRRHLRYPEDMFRVQSAAYATYHIDNASDFYSRSDAWDVAQDPGSGRVETGGQGGTQGTVGPQGTITVPREARMDPYYLLMRLPQEETEEFLILQPFVPASRDDSRKELTAFLVAKSDPGRYGDLEVFVMPRDQQVDGPAIVASRIQQDPAISEQITLLSRAGSEVLLGNLLVIPIEDSLLFVRPMYVQAEATPVPEFKFAIVVYEDNVVMRPTLQEALTAIFGDAPETREEERDEDGVEPTEPDGELGDTVRELLDQAAQAFADAETALREGDLAEYQRRIREARQLIERARQESDQSTTTTTAPPAET